MDGCTLLLQEFRTATDFWAGMVEPDVKDALAQPADLRAAFHAAISLFHMHDWVWQSHQDSVRRNFTFIDKTGATIVAHDEKSFANALEQSCTDFGLMRGVATGAKHLVVKDIRPVPNAPRHASDIALRHFPGIGGYNTPVLAYGRAGAYGSPPRVVLAGGDSTEINFSAVAQSVHNMWIQLAKKHGWLHGEDF